MGDIFKNLSGASAAKAEAKSAQNIANFNAALKEREAKAIKAKSAFESKRQAKQAAEIKSKLTAQLATAGGLGSPVAGDLAAAQGEELELADLLIAFEGEALADRARTQAELDRLAGRQVKLKGKNLATARNIQLATQIATTPVGKKGGTLLTGFN